MPLRDGLGTDNFLLPPVSAPLCQIENKNQDQNHYRRGGNCRHTRPPYWVLLSLPFWHSVKL